MNVSSFWLLLSYVTLSAFSHAAVADDQVRAMIRFDESGHRIEQLYRSTNLSRPVPRSTDRLRARAPNAGLPSVSWYSAEGTLLLQSSFVDPRVKHVPLQGSASRINPIQYAPQTTGVYLIAGPAGAVRAIINLPPLNAGQMRLSAEQWALDFSSFP